MQVSTGQFFRRQNENMVDLQTKIANLQNQIATGKKLELPSDDPVAFSDASRYKYQLGKISQFARNIDNVTQRLTAEEAALGQFANVLTRIQELALQGANDTMGPSERSTIALEIDLLRDELVTLGNTRDNFGAAIFGGYQSKGDIFKKGDDRLVEYVGDSNVPQVEVADGIYSPSGSNGMAIFMQVNIPGETGAQSVFELVEETIQELRNGRSGKDKISGIAASIDHIIGSRVLSGTRISALATQKEILDSDKLQSQVMLSGVQDTDIERVVSELKQKLLSLEASQASFVKIAELSLFNYLR
jgi:flagellar hook-associated protein 3 FlgL